MEKKSAIVEFFGDDLKRTALFVVLAGISLVISFFFGKDFPVDPAWVAIILCGTPILYEAVTGLILRHDIKADVLVAVAIVASLILQEWFAAGEVAFIMELGGLLEDISADRSRAGIEKLISMVPSKARLIIDGKETEVDAESVRVGQIIRILPGDTVPLDGNVVSGHSYVDQSSLTGESVPVAKEEGSEVFSGTVNQLGTFDMEVTCTAQDSSFQRLVDMVESTDAERTRVVKVADKWATYLVALVFVIAAATYLLTQEVSRALTVMIVFCPCAFILATPTAVVAAIGNLSKHGILVRDGDALEKMAHTDRLVFDKTGTLTEGKPYVTSVTPSEGFTEEQLLRYAGTVEKSSEHPYAGAILARCGDMPLGEAEGVEVTVGRGISATVDGRLVKVGNLASPAFLFPPPRGRR
jgi:heavy metal translocating P-type ATPase